MEIDALLAANIAAFVLTSGNLTGAQTATAFVMAWPRIQKAVRDYALPFVAAVDAKGSIRFLTEAVRHAAAKRER